MDSDSSGGTRKNDEQRRVFEVVMNHVQLRNLAALAITSMAATGQPVWPLRLVTTRAH